MKLAPPVYIQRVTGKRASSGGFTFAEVLVAFAIGTIFLAAIVVTSMTFMRSFVGMYNYTDMSMTSRMAMDKIARDVRSSSAAAVPSANELDLTSQGSTITYTWDSGTGNVIREQTGQPTQTMLTQCDSWTLSIYQGTPTQSYDNITNSGAATTKLLSIKWTCSRTIMGKKVDSETVQEARIVLRNN